MSTAIKLSNRWQGTKEIVDAHRTFKSGDWRTIWLPKISSEHARLLLELEQDFRDKGNANIPEDFDDEVDDPSDYGVLDPDDEYDWYAITLGWAIAKGLNAQEAHWFAIIVRYGTDLM